tara:strand:+ start:18565 stop:18798 length:234 start_codon:yes stop_codon:yes gene_type:complete
MENQKSVRYEQRVTIKTSEIIATDIVIINDFREFSESKAYKYNGIWCFDYLKEPFGNDIRRYELTHDDVNIDVIRQF